MGKKIKFEAEGAMHELEVRRLSNNLVSALTNFGIPDPENEYGIEKFVKAIDGEPVTDEGHDLEFEAFPIVIDFLKKKLINNTNTE